MRIPIYLMSDGKIYKYVYERNAYRTDKVPVEGAELEWVTTSWKMYDEVDSSPYAEVTYERFDIARKLYTTKVTNEWTDIRIDLTQ